MPTQHPTNDTSNPRGTGRITARGTGLSVGLACLLVLVGITGCKENDMQSEPSPATPSGPKAETETRAVDEQLPPKQKVAMDKKKSSPPAPVAGGVKHSIPAEKMDTLIATIASETGVSTDEVVIVRAENTTWNDGSLGCPQPNMAYTQALVEGYWVILRANGEEFDMRAATRGRFTRCTGSTRQPPIRYEDQ